MEVAATHADNIVRIKLPKIFYIECCDCYP